MSWETVFEDQIGDRPVTVQKYTEGGWRVRTTHGQDDPGGLPKVEGNATIMPMGPTEKGRPITIEGTPEEIKEDLEVEGFSEEEIDEIMGHIKD